MKINRIQFGIDNCFCVEGDSDLFVGDALMNIVAPLKSPMYGNREEMQKSAAIITTFKDVTIHFGHGKSVTNRKW